jgi:hypothetical protein
MTTTTPAGAGLSYGALAFAAGATLGPVRELALAPQLGGLQAALAEAVLMAPLLWLAARASVGRLAQRPLRARAVVAGVAVAVVLGCELALGLVLDQTGLADAREPRDLAERLIGLPLLAWLAALPFLVRRDARPVP